MFWFLCLSNGDNNFLIWFSIVREFCSWQQWNYNVTTRDSVSLRSLKVFLFATDRLRLFFKVCDNIMKTILAEIVLFAKEWDQFGLTRNSLENTIAGHTRFHFKKTVVLVYTEAAYFHI